MLMAVPDVVSGNAGNGSTSDRNRFHGNFMGIGPAWLVAHGGASAAAGRDAMSFARVVRDMCDLVVDRLEEVGAGPRKVGRTLPDQRA
jgi:hypothetical protein